MSLAIISLIRKNAARFWEVLLNQFNNDTVVGSLAMGGAALITSLGWSCFYQLKNYVNDKIFTVYIVPRHTPQHRYFISWLKVFFWFNFICA